MATLQLQVQDEFLEDLLKMLPKDKVTVIDQSFLENQKKLNGELENFLNDKTEFTPYYENMKEIDNWIKEGEKS